MIKGDTVRTPHGVGVVEHFEWYPYLFQKDQKLQIEDSIDNIPENYEFFRVGVRIPGHRLEVAYFMPQELS